MRSPKSFFILTGPVHSGKTSFLAAGLVSCLRNGIRPCGYLSPAVFSAGNLVGYDLLPLAGGDPLPFLRKSRAQGAQRVGPYYLIPGTLKVALDIVRQAGEGRTLILDEVGPLELEGGGIWPAVEKALARRDPILLVIREGLVEPFQRRIPALATAAVFRVGDNLALDKALGVQVTI